MKQSKWWVCGLAVLLMVTWTFTMAQEPGRGRPGGETDRRGPSSGGMFGSFDYAGIAKEMDLSPAQAEKLTGLILNQQISGIAGRLELDAGQKAKVKDACMAAAKDALAGETGVMRGIMETIRNDILTPAQKERMGGGRPGGEGGREGGARPGGEGGREGGARPGGREGGKEAGKAAHEHTKRPAEK